MTQSQAAEECASFFPHDFTPFFYLLRSATGKVIAHCSDHWRRERDSEKANGRGGKINGVITTKHENERAKKWMENVKFFIKIVGGWQCERKSKSLFDFAAAGHCLVPRSVSNK